MRSKENHKNVEPDAGRIGEGAVGPLGTILTMAYLIAFTLLLLYSLVVFWTRVTPPGTSTDTFFFWTVSVSDEAGLLITVALAGGLGALLHALRSFYWYVGNRDFRRSWLAMYVLLPFVGMALALVFYFVIRGGFFSPQAQVEQTSPFGFVALASLVGLFSEQAVLKLKELSETLLSKPPKGEDHVAGQEHTPGPGKTSRETGGGAGGKVPGE